MQGIFVKKCKEKEKCIYYKINTKEISDFFILFLIPFYQCKLWY